MGMLTKGNKSAFYHIPESTQQKSRAKVKANMVCKFKASHFYFPSGVTKGLKIKESEIISSTQGQRRIRSSMCRTFYIFNYYITCIISVWLNHLCEVAVMTHSYCKPQIKTITIFTAQLEQDVAKVHMDVIDEVT